MAFAEFFYEYGWTGQRQFKSPFYMALYYGGPLLGAVLLFAALRLRPIDRLKLLSALFSAGVSLYALEFLLEWRSSGLFASTRTVMSLLIESKDKQRQAAALSKQWGVAIDARTADETLADVQRTAADAIPIMTASNHLFVSQDDGSLKSAISVDGREVMPLAGVANRVTLLCNENGQWIDYRSDQRGFNNPPEVWGAEALEMAVVGDSFTHGYCVPGDKSFAALIRQRHPATLNLGIAGDGPLLMLATLKEYLPALRPKTVLWFYYEGNDLTDLQVELKSPLLRNYLKNDFTQSLLARQRDIDRAMVGEIPRLKAQEQDNRKRSEENTAENRVGEFMRFAKLRERLGMVGGREIVDSGASAEANLAIFRNIVLLANREVAGWGGRLVFVYLPSWSRYTNVHAPEEAARQDVTTLVHDLGIPFLDITDAFQAHGDPLSLFPFRRPGHYNEMGHRLVAAEVLKTLAQGQ
ncbi:MAG: SGNH/GDSL hydrolase family protein [Acidobacteriota bacterium]